MAVIIKNKTVDPIEIEDFGITAFPEVELDITNEYDATSVEFQTHIDTGSIVFVNADSTELTEEESQQFITGDSNPPYDASFNTGPLVKIYQGIDVAGHLQLTNVGQVIPFTYDSHKDGYYEHSTTINPGEITILQDGLYKLSVMTTIETFGSGGGTRGNPILKMELDTGTGWQVQPDQMGGYVREDGSNSLSCSITGIGFFDFLVGNKIRFCVLDTVSSEPDERTVPYSSRVLIEYIDKTGTASGVTAALNDIGDVNAPAPNDQDTIKYDGATGTWITTAIVTYTDEEAQDAVGTILTDTDTVDFTYDDGTPTITADAKTQMSITSDSSGLMLEGDEASPGNDQVYGTDGAGNKGWKDDPAGGGAFGTEFNEMSDDSESSTTSESWQEKLDMDVTGLPAGTYRVGWYAELRQDDTSGEIHCKIEADDVEIAYFWVEPSDTENWYPFSGFDYVTWGSGDRDVEIYFRRLETGTTHIRRARVELWRVS